MCRKNTLPTLHKLAPPYICSVSTIYVICQTFLISSLSSFMLYGLLMKPAGDGRLHACQFPLC